MLAYIRCITNSLDELAWFRILKLIPGIGDTYSRNVSTLCSTTKDFLINNKYSKRFFYKDLISLNNLIKSVDECSFDKMYSELQSEYIKLRKRLIEEMNTDEDNREALKQELTNDIEILKELENIASKYSSPNRFLDDILLDNDSSEEVIESVTISTIHSAKGLEWKYVFILDCVEGFIPSQKAIDEEIYENNSSEIEEELRCFYVAMTRAKKELFLMAPAEAVIFGRYTETSHSRFLNLEKTVYHETKV